MSKLTKPAKAHDWHGLEILVRQAYGYVWVISDGLNQAAGRIWKVWIQSVLVTIPLARAFSLDTYQSVVTSENRSAFKSVHQEHGPKDKNRCPLQQRSTFVAMLTIRRIQFGADIPGTLLLSTVDSTIWAIQNRSNVGGGAKLDNFESQLIKRSLEVTERKIQGLLQQHSFNGCHFPPKRIMGR